MRSDRFWTVKFASLRYAIAWLGYAGMRAVVLLPFPWQLACGRALGRAGRVLSPARRRIVECNLAACFPELPVERRDELLRAHFESLGLSLIETAMGWFGNQHEVRSRVRIEGEQYLRTALGNGRGVILYSAHFTTFEFFWPALAPQCPRLSGMYKSQRNPVMNSIMTKGRRRNFAELFAKDDLRAMLRNLRANGVVWYAADQSFTGKSSALLPFFGEPAMTNTAIGRIAKASGAVVLPYFCRRIGKSYCATIGAPLTEWPTGDDERDAQRLNTLLEDYIRLCPEQYWWVHKRFKGRPAPYRDLYSVARSSH